jgi:hypothetical protein
MDALVNYEKQRVTITVPRVAGCDPTNEVAADELADLLCDFQLHGS